MELKDYRKQLDEIDGKLLSLFAERMNIVAESPAGSRRIISRYWIPGVRKKNCVRRKRKARRNWRNTAGSCFRY